jgi:hypothetical protein
MAKAAASLIPLPIACMNTEDIPASRRVALITRMAPT